MRKPYSHDFRYSSRSTLAKDTVARAKEIVENAAKEGVVIRILGGAAIKLCCPSASLANLERIYPDIDLVAYSKQSREIKGLLARLGYVPNKRFNALHGHKRLMFFSEEGYRVDIFLDKFEMCHTLDLRGRLELGKLTIPLADLLLTKLQVIQLTEKDVKDVICLLKDHGFGNDDESLTINLDYVRNLCCKDWGLYKTIMINLGKVLSLAEKFNLNKVSRFLVEKRIKEIVRVLEKAPKSLKWKLRAKIGEKVKWYEEPEEVVMEISLDTLAQRSS